MNVGRLRRTFGSGKISDKETSDSDKGHVVISGHVSSGHVSSEHVSSEHVSSGHVPVGGSDQPLQRQAFEAAARKNFSHMKSADLISDCETTASCQSYKFFDSSNVEYKHLRELLAMQAMDECIRWLESGGLVAIHDATNSNIERRKALLEYTYSKLDDVNVLFIGI